MGAALGLGLVLTRNTALTMAQRLASDRLLAGVLGLLEMMMVAGTGIGAALALLIIHLLGTTGALVVTGEPDSHDAAGQLADRLLTSPQAEVQYPS